MLIQEEAGVVEGAHFVKAGSSVTDAELNIVVCRLTECLTVYMSLLP